MYVRELREQCFPTPSLNRVRVILASLESLINFVDENLPLRRQIQFTSKRVHVSGHDAFALMISSEIIIGLHFGINSIFAQLARDKLIRIHLQNVSLYAIICLYFRAHLCSGSPGDSSSPLGAIKWVDL